MIALSVHMMTSQLLVCLVILCSLTSSVVLAALLLSSVTSTYQLCQTDKYGLSLLKIFVIILRIFTEI